MEILRPAGKFSYSFKAETLAMISAMEYAGEVDDRTVNIWTDSKSLCQAIESGMNTSDADLEALKRKIHKVASSKEKVRSAWIPSHIGIDGNEQADRAANRAREERTERSCVNIKIVKAKVKQQNKDEEEKSDRYKTVYKENIKKKEGMWLS